MKKLLNFSFSKIYMISVILISLLIMGGYFSYAMFTVSEERSNAISIVTGNLIYDLKVDGEDIESLVIPANTTMEFIVVLSNPNNRIARFNFYYLGNLPDGVSAGYIVEENFNIPPEEVGINLEKNGTSGSSNTYKIKVTNASDSNITINLGVSVGLDYNDLTLPSNGHLFEEYSVPVKDIVLVNVGDKGDTYDDGVDTFITGEDPNNYIWYSGKLWRAVSVNNDEGTVKLVTQWVISAIPFGTNSVFKESHMEMWLNDTTVDGFLGNLRDYENFIVTDAKWNYSSDTRNLGSITRPTGNNVVEDAVGLLNVYEYQTSYRGTTYSEGYLRNYLFWWTLTPYSPSNTRQVSNIGTSSNYTSTYAYGVRPSIVLRKDVRVVSGEGTEENPYRLLGDNDDNLNGVKLNTRYSGEYIKFGNEPNNLYQIVSHEIEGLTKITSAMPLKNSSGNFVTSAFGSNSTFSSTNTIGKFLNGTFLNSYLTADNRNMLVTNNTWYLGTVGVGENYRLTKYTNTSMTGYAKNTTANVSLLRLGEQLSGYFEEAGNGKTSIYWLLTPYTSNKVWAEGYNGDAIYDTNNYVDITYSIKPALYLKENVIITGGDGTKNDPFILDLA